MAIPLASSGLGGSGLDGPAEGIDLQPGPSPRLTAADAGQLDLQTAIAGEPQAGRPGGGCNTG
ncbi:MAG: hypothetical protein KDA45_11925, partial [Planctomycetales bacterium]|nr:hypothetical protein [Planctomycetales bacterium]